MADYHFVIDGAPLEFVRAPLQNQPCDIFSLKKESLCSRFDFLFLFLSSTSAEVIALSPKKVYSRFRLAFLYLYRARILDFFLTFFSLRPN